MVGVLETALEDSAVIDVRKRPELVEALEHLQNRRVPITRVEAFRAALDHRDTSTRYEAGCHALCLIRRQLWGAT